MLAQAQASQRLANAVWALDKTVLYTGSVFEYIRAWRFQPLAQGQSRMTTPCPVSTKCMSKAMIACEVPTGSLLLANIFTMPPCPERCCKEVHDIVQALGECGGAPGRRSEATHHSRPRRPFDCW